MDMRGTSDKGIVGVIIWAVLVVTIFLVILVNVVDIGGIPGVNLSDLPGGVGFVVDTVIAAATPIVSVIFLIVAPVGENENVQMIAFAVFLLLTLVGTKTLRFAFRGQPKMAFFVSVIIGLIAARSLTATVLHDTALGASPVAAASLLLGFIPIYALTRNMGRWTVSNLYKMTIYTAVAFVYSIIFWVAFDARLLGLVYGIAIIIMGAGEVVARYLEPRLGKSKNTRIGKFISWAGKVETTAEEMEEGSRS